MFFGCEDEECTLRVEDTLHIILYSPRSMWDICMYVDCRQVQLNGIEFRFLYVKEKPYTFKYTQCVCVCVQCVSVKKNSLEFSLHIRIQHSHLAILLWIFLSFFFSNLYNIPQQYSNECVLVWVFCFVCFFLFTFCVLNGFFFVIFTPYKF